MTDETNTETVSDEELKAALEGVFRANAKWLLYKQVFSGRRPGQNQGFVPVRFRTDDCAADLWIRPDLIQLCRYLGIQFGGPFLSPV